MNLSKMSSSQGLIRFGIHLCALVSSTAIRQTKIDTLYDMPVSNHGARIRMLIKAKGIPIEIKEPTDIGGGLKSAEYFALNPQGKMPLLVTDAGYPIPESDTIARYIMTKYSHIGPSFSPDNLSQQVLCDQICRLHDIYLSPIQGCMYKPRGFIFSTFGSNRPLALAELKRQLEAVEKLLTDFPKTFPDLSLGSFLCGNEISLADATLYPTMVFCKFMLPQFFGWKDEEILGPKLESWYNFMTTQVPVAMEVCEEMLVPLNSWKESGRFGPIMEEMRSVDNNK